MSQSLVVDKRTFADILGQLAADNSPAASVLYVRLAGAWRGQAERQRVTYAASESDLELLKKLDLPEGTLDPGLLRSGWKVLYRHPTKPHVEVTVFTKSKPPKTRVFNVRGGRHRLEAVQATRVKKPAKEEEVAKTKSKKAAEVEELDELDELEDLEDLDVEDEEEEDVEEPEDEDEDEDEEPVAKKRSKSKAKKGKAKKAAVEEDDDEDEDEDDEPAPKRKKGKTRQSQAKTKSKGGKKGAPPGPRALADGRQSPQDVAELAGVDARAVRVYLRSHEEDWPKPEGEFRHSFTKKQAQKLAKEIKRSRAE